MTDEIKIGIDLNILRTHHSDGRVEKAILYLETDKSSRGGVGSSARAGWLGPDRMVNIAYGFKGDFNKSVFVDQRARATRKKLESQHAAAFTQDVIDSLITEATDYYKAVHFDFCDYAFIK